MPLSRHCHTTAFDSLILPDRSIYSIPAPWVLLTLALQGLAVLGWPDRQPGVFSDCIRSATPPAVQPGQPDQMITTGFY
jgi:hypothetical protein